MLSPSRGLQANLCRAADTGSPYIAKKTRGDPCRLGLKPCFTPIKSPQSNGIWEALVNTLKRDYVPITPLPDARSVLGSVAGWIKDRTENHPRSGHKMRSPREVIPAQTAAA
jgi:putative transposase